MSRRRTPDIADAADRAAAVHERKRNLLIDAGAGTGKTTILVRRFVELVAPAEDAAPGASAIPTGRIAAITFTRKAAGELRLRIRERLLATLAGVELSAVRRDRLRAALRGLDTAAIGTIHSFADRLLRLRPMEANISPEYEIADEIEPLVEETTEALLHGAEHGGLGGLLARAAPEVRALAAEAQETVRLYLEAGLLSFEQVRTYVVQGGLDSIVRAFVEHRDHPPRQPPPARPDLAAFRKVGRQFVEAVAGLDGRSQGADWLRRRAKEVAALVEDDDPAQVMFELRHCFRRPPEFRMKAEFDSDKKAWGVWNALFKTADKATDAPSLLAQMKAPLAAWMAGRLVRLFPVIVALYERTKARHRVLDQTDLLLKLRDLLRDDAAARREYQQLYDHILVDEFQDTDPLQAEILAYLCATDRGELRPGALTLVGDPKQSIYRFRRADVATYDRTQAWIARGPHLRARLATNFRSRPALIDFFNDRFARVLGEPAADGRLFDEKSGTVFHQGLHAGRATTERPASVQVIPLSAPDPKETRVDEYRALEGAALARYVRWLLEKSHLEVTDPGDGRSRPIRAGDIGILAFSTLTLHFLFRAFDELGVPYASRGGVLFLSDPLHRQFLMGLRALADRDDGPAQAALLRPPFFAVDLAELLRERIDPDGHDPQATRAREARAIVDDLRRRRFERSPGATARDLLENTAFARHVALGPNGTERVARLRELCLQVDRLAAEESLDFDAVTARLRGWVTHPVPLDPPRPVGDDAVQVLTVHQSKGLEWPVVILWDGCALINDRERSPVWQTTLDGDAWFLKIEGLEWEHPSGRDLLQHELAMQNAERRRLMYVAATRARDLLVMAKPEGKNGQYISAALLDEAPEGLVEELKPYSEDKGAVWSRGIKPPDPVKLDGPPCAVEAELAARWTSAFAESSRSRFSPRGISSQAHLVPPARTEEAPTPAPARRPSRFGTVFGDTVHRAIGLVLRGQSATAAVEEASKLTGLVEHRSEAVEDVVRAIDALASLGISAPIGANVRLEYPLAAPGSDCTLLAGYADLVHAGDDGTITVIDFKTDAPPRESVAVTHANYVLQVETYARMLRPRGATPAGRSGLLFTATGDIHWVV